MSTDLPLNNKTILITRPEGLADSLLQRIKDLGGTALHYPVIRIINVEKTDALNTIIKRFPTFDIAIFISPTAVIKTLEIIKTLPKNIELAVIGRSTQSMLKKQGYSVQMVPDDFNTESLLQLPALQKSEISTKSIVIFRGVGGRDLLSDTLKQRGAEVAYAETYQRTINSLPSLNEDEINCIDVLAITSNEGLQNLYDLTADDVKTRLTSLALIVPGNRAFKLAQSLGFKDIILANNASDDAYMDALFEHFSI